MIEQNDPVLMQLFRDKCDQLMKLSDHRHEIPAEMRAENNGGVDSAFRHRVRPAADSVQIIRGRPVQIPPEDPPACHSVFSVLLHLSTCSQSAHYQTIHGLPMK